MASRTSRVQAPSKSSLSTRSQTSGRQSSKTSVTAKKSAGKITGPATSTATKANKKFVLPALSVGPRVKLTESEFDKIKKRTIRRNAPPGEDPKQIKQFLRTLKHQPITVQEFISLIAPSTGDRGSSLRQIMQEHLNSFRQLARQVYDTILQDVSDVLHNQQLQLSEFYKERKALLHDKMMRKIEEIYAMAAGFDFERYAREGESYLKQLFPIPAAVQVEPEEMEMMKRQAAYHRLSWLRSEGERLNEENNSLKQRLNQLKREHQDERSKMLELEEEAEAKREALEAAQAQRTETLEGLSETLERRIIDKEKKMRLEKDQDALQATGGGAAASKGVKKTKSKRKVRRPEWHEVAAREMECYALKKGKTSEAANVVRQASHGSPHTTPPGAGGGAPRQVSPFHYSPPSHQTSEYSERANSTLNESTASSGHRTPARAPPQPPRRASQAPQDTWGGFY